MLFCQQPFLSRSFAAQRWFDGGNAASFKSINHASNCRVRQTTEFHNLHCPITFSAQPHNPLTPLTQLPQGRISCVVLCQPRLAQAMFASAINGRNPSRASGGTPESSVFPCVRQRTENIPLRAEDACTDQASMSGLNKGFRFPDCQYLAAFAGSRTKKCKAEQGAIYE